MALIQWQRPTLRHEIDDDARVSWLELFFDLIYVAALIQLGDRLSADVTWDGVGRFAAVFALLWWTWTGTTVFVNRFAADDVLHRLLVFVQMFAVGNLALVAVAPVEDRSRWLVVAYVAARAPLIAMYVRAYRRIPAARQLAVHYGVTFTASAAVWTVSLLVPTPARYVLWAAALAGEFLAPPIVARRVEAPPIHDHHLRERYALFTIIVLGESFVKVLSELSGVGLSWETQVVGGLAFAISAALWWTYFDDVADSDIRPVPVRFFGISGRMWWVYAHLPLTMGLTALGVAQKKAVVVESFDALLKGSYLWLLVGAIAVALVATAVIDAVTVSPHHSVRNGLRVGARLAAAALVVVARLLLGDQGVLTVVGVIAAITVAQIAVEVVLAAQGEERTVRRVAGIVAERSGGCEHLAAARPPEAGARACEACRALGVPWVQLRMCLQCGHVGCCDDSEGRHATAHHEETGHPTIATLEATDEWAYCFVDDVVDDTWWAAHRADEPTS